jgi:acetate kinase
VRIDPTVLAALGKFIPLAPLHQPHNLTPIRVLMERAPDLPQVACFDTSFHRTSPPISQRFAIPAELHDAGVQRYGFHGLSYEYVASVLPKYDANAAAGKTVVLHLGNGASMCALDGARSIASTMGFTAVEGLPMGTRCGSIDPGVLLYLMDQRGMDARAIEKLIYNQSGLLGVSGISSDMRTLLASADPRAALAVDLYLPDPPRAGRSPRRSGGSTPSCSPPVSARTRPPSANACAAMRPGSGSRSIRPPMPRAGPASAPPGHAPRRGRFPPTRS